MIVGTPDRTTAPSVRSRDGVQSGARLRMRAAGIALIISLVAAPCAGMEISRVARCAGSDVLRLRGDIEAGHYVKFRSYFDGGRRIVGLELDSPGGSLYEGLRIATMTRERRLSPFVGEGMRFRLRVHLPGWQQTVRCQGGKDRRSRRWQRLRGRGFRHNPGYDSVREAIRKIRYSQLDHRKDGHDAARQNHVSRPDGPFRLEGNRSRSLQSRRRCSELQFRSGEPSGFRKWRAHWARQDLPQTGQS
jgi:hypothetical protein